MLNDKQLADLDAAVSAGVKAMLSVEDGAPFEGDSESRAVKRPTGNTTLSDAHLTHSRIVQRLPSLRSRSRPLPLKRKQRCSSIWNVRYQPSSRLSKRQAIATLGMCRTIVSLPEMLTLCALYFITYNETNHVLSKARRGLL